MPDSPHQPVVLSLPFEGRWLTQNSPAQRVPSHGTDLFGTRYAIDFVGVDDLGRTATHTDWRTVLATEPPDRYLGFGRPILAPADGLVVATQDGEIDHAGRRSPLRLLGYALGQAGRVRAGVRAIAGNVVIVALPDAAAVVALVHLRRGSLRVGVGDEVVTGQVLAECGNSGNSTQPHLHLQAMDGPDLATARGLPISFRPFREWRKVSREAVVRESGLPAEGSVVEALPLD
jgi:murein DD-endopeptidase MepM/ murein hydrolase activator NlpD